MLVRDLNLQAARQDERRIEVIANGLPLWGGSQLAVDTTLVSPLTSAGAPRRRSGATAGAALAEARRSKERTYPEFGRASRCRLVVLGIEVGGRWSAEAANFVRLLARARARTARLGQKGFRGLGFSQEGFRSPPTLAVNRLKAVRALGYKGST